MHLPGFTDKQKAEIVKGMRGPEGGVEFILETVDILNPDLGDFIIYEVSTGAIFYLLRRDQELNLKFYHATPGTGTRVATVSLKEFASFAEVQIRFEWSPEEIRLGVRNLDKDIAVANRGRASDIRYYVGDKGSITYIGSIASDVEITIHGKKISYASAIEAWNSAIEAIGYLKKGTSEDGYRFEKVRANMILVMLVTGFEVYCRRRFLEIEGEGNPPNFNALAEKFLKFVCKNNLLQAYIEDAEHDGITPTRKLIDSKRRSSGINFQNYEDCKAAYSRAYGIRFVDNIGVSSELIRVLKKVMQYRHDVIHVSATDETISKSDVEIAIGVYNEFIQRLHIASLKLRPKEFKTIDI